MSKLQKFLDEKTGPFIGRIYMLIALFIGNAFIAIGATLHFNYGGSPIMMILGILITVVSIAILSTPTYTDDLK